MTDDQTFVVTLVLLAGIAAVPAITLAGARFLYPPRADGTGSIAEFRLVQVLAVAMLAPLIPLLALNDIIGDQAVTTLLGVLTGYIFSLRREGRRTPPAQATAAASE